MDRKHAPNMGSAKPYFFFFVVMSNFLILTAIAVLPDEIPMAALKKELQGVEWEGPESNYCSWVGITCNALNLSVEALELPRRGLKGNISAISELKLIKRLDLSGNILHGFIPFSLGSLLGLELLDLSANKFGGLIPFSIGSLRSLRSLNLSNNLLIGGIPDELKNLKSLQELQVSGNNLNGSIPLWISELSGLRVFSAYENYLSGNIPDKLGTVSPLELLNLHSNQLEGVIPESIFSSGKLKVLDLTLNRLTGSIPESIGKCQNLSSLRIGNNRLVGRVPTSIGNISSLTYFEANNNRLSDKLPVEFSWCSNLTLLNLASNNLTGFVPIELGDLKNLQEFIISDNGLIGEVPRSLLKCRSLSKLDLSNNRFNGSLPENICSTSRIQFLLLAQNFIVGEIPPVIGDCIRLLELQLGGNYLTGRIPPEMGRIKNLQIALNLSSNHLHGELPHELGKLDKLVSLDVSNNQLSGPIPSEFKGMLSLIEVNFSNNQLTGPVPIFTPFQKSSSSSFLGNEGLCGDPLNTNCAFNAEYDKKNHKASYKMVLTVIGSCLAIFITVSVVVILFMVREREEMKSKSCKDGEISSSTSPLVITGNVFVDSLKQAVDFNCCVEATTKDSNLLSNGTFSTTYKAIMPSGLILSVKKLKSVDRTVVHHQNKMIRELEKLGNLIHPNVIRPIGYAIFEDVALLLHPHIINGTLAQLLHDSSKVGYEPDWPRRLSISTGLAESLAFLHHSSIIHLDISSCNVFLDAHYNSLLGEIEISRLLDPLKGTASISAVAGSFGYIPPEYAYSMRVTAPGNVYSFGVILLEILTTRLPVDEVFGEGVDLVKWVQGAPRRGETPEQIMDARLSTVSFAWRKQMLEMLKVAMACTDASPSNRPKMKKVVEMLLEVKKS